METPKQTPQENSSSNATAPETKTPEPTPRNYQAVIDWCAKWRPDLGAVVEAEKNNNAFIMLISLGFEAGRQFQHDHPTEALYPQHSYGTSI